MNFVFQLWPFKGWGPRWIVELLYYEHEIFIDLAKRSYYYQTHPRSSCYQGFVSFEFYECFIPTNYALAGTLAQIEIDKGLGSFVDSSNYREKSQGVKLSQIHTPDHRHNSPAFSDLGKNCSLFASKSFRANNNYKLIKSQSRLQLLYQHNYYLSF